MNKLANQMLIIFGASGDLTARKLIPALYNLYKGQHLPEHFVVLGASRSDMTDEDFRDNVVRKSSYLAEELNGAEKQHVEDFADKLFYEDLGDTYETDFDKLSRRIASLNKKFKTGSVNAVATKAT